MVTEAQVRVLRRKLMEGKTQEAAAAGRGHECARPHAIDQFTDFIEQWGPEVGSNGVVLHRELMRLGFTGSYQQVQRWLKPYRAKRKWAELATVRFETAPGEQAQVDYGQLQVWIGEQPETVHLFVFTRTIRGGCLPGVPPDVGAFMSRVRG